MSKLETQQIKETFSRLALHPLYLEHEPALTSEDAARIRGTDLSQGIKSLLFTNGSYEYVIVNVPAHQKVDARKVAQCLDWKNAKMASPDDVLSETGCEVGSVPPFGHKNKMQIVYDRTIFVNHESSFNIGLRTHSVRIPTSEMKIVFADANAIEGDFI